MLLSLFIRKHLHNVYRYYIWRWNDHPISGKKSKEYFILISFEFQYLPISDSLKPKNVSIGEMQMQDRLAKAAHLMNAALPDASFHSVRRD